MSEMKRDLQETMGRRTNSLFGHSKQYRRNGTASLNAFI
jgi:hypothetical protein